MTTKTDVEFCSFFIFNSFYGAVEGEEEKKIICYYPSSEVLNIKIKNVGLVEGIIRFTNTFKPDSPVNSLHTQKKRQLYYEAEKDFWMVLTLNVPFTSQSKDGTTHYEYLNDDIQDNVYEAVLKYAYLMFRLFNNTYESIVKESGVDGLKEKIDNFYSAYLKTIKWAYCDILSVFSGIQYLPLDKQTFLSVQCFINLLECNFPPVKHTAFLYNDHLVWNGIDPLDMQIIYQYLIGTLVPASVETELQGGSMPRNVSSPFAALHRGRFITGATNLNSAKSIKKVPKIYVFHQEPTAFFMVVYRVLSATVCLFVDTSTEMVIEFFKELDAFMHPKLPSIVSDIAAYCYKLQNIIPSNNASDVHLDNKQTGNLACPKDSLKVMADIHHRKGFFGKSGETVLKTTNDYWVIGLTSNLREFYVAVQQKNASVIDISDEVKKLCDGELRGIFFQRI